MNVSGMIRHSNTVLCLQIWKKSAPQLQRTLFDNNHIVTQPKTKINMEDLL